MDYKGLVKAYQELEETQSTLGKTSILAELFKDSGDQLDTVVLLAMGRPFPYWKDRDLGISSKTMVKIISEASNASEKEIENVWKEEGDLGLTAQRVLEKGGQQSLMSQKLTIERVYGAMETVAEIEGSTGKGSMEKKRREVVGLMSDSSPVETCYIARTFISNLRLGVGEGLVRDALAEAFFEGKNTEKIQHAYNVTNDFSVVAEACREGIEAVENLEMRLFRPIKSMLAKKVESIEEGFEEVGKPAAIDWKYDGVRAQIHCKDGEVRVFTRRLENITEQFPDVVEAVERHVDADNFIIDTEIVGYDPDDGSAIPFQQLSRRVKRKYDIEEMKQEIPVEVRPFDLIYLEESKISEPYSRRFQQLSDILIEEEKELRMVDHTETDEEEKVAEMDQKALSARQEGIMMKSLDAEYKPGNRVGYMVKLKPVMETLDLAVIGAKWSEGRRSGWLGRLKLGVWNEETQEYEMVGRMATGLTDEELQEITEKLEPLIVAEDGRDVDVRPEVILEVEYEEIQKSPNYESGYALRFPRMKAFRDDKEESDTKEKLLNLYEDQ